jgi:hypothetical protein
MPKALKDWGTQINDLAKSTGYTVSK